MKKFKLNNTIYSIELCTNEDIPSHIEKVLSYWLDANVDIALQQSLLEKAIQEQTAFKLVDPTNNTKAVIYLIKIDHNKAESNLLWFENKRMFAILMYGLRFNLPIVQIFFQPHKKGFIPFQFIVEESSMRLFNVFNSPLEINLYSNKSMKLYEQHFKRYNVEEVE